MIEIYINLMPNHLQLRREINLNGKSWVLNHTSLRKLINWRDCPYEKTFGMKNMPYGCSSWWSYHLMRAGLDSPPENQKYWWFKTRTKRISLYDRKKFYQTNFIKTLSSNQFYQISFIKSILSNQFHQINYITFY